MSNSLFISIIISFLFNFQVLAKDKITYGSWQGKLELNDSTILPFHMTLKKFKDDNPIIQIQNNTENIELKYVRTSIDTLVYEFPEFDSELHILFTKKDFFTGYWLNKAKKNRYEIPLTGHYCKNDLFECKQIEIIPTITLSQRWKTTFYDNGQPSWMALGLFDQNKSFLTGTFLTETGDYRFLEGNVYGNKMYLSCFDGSHAFLFKAEYINNELVGNFYSGKHYKTEWNAIADDTFELTDPDKLTYVTSEKPLEFSFSNLEGTAYHYPGDAAKDKVRIIQIMGTWCPNCMDETKYFLDLYKEYNHQGLEIILIGYEAGSNEEQYTKNLTRFRERHDIPFTMLVGGAANKNNAASDFPMLNDIISFPTSIFINKKGEIVKVHTGFNGPSTGQYYIDYKNETEDLLEKLLKE